MRHQSRLRVRTEQTRAASAHSRHLEETFFSAPLYRTVRSGRNPVLAWQTQNQPIRKTVPEFHGSRTAPVHRTVHRLRPPHGGKYPHHPVHEPDRYRCHPNRYPLLLSGQHALSPIAPHFLPGPGADCQKRASRDNFCLASQLPSKTGVRLAENASKAR